MLLGARDVTDMGVGSGALLGDWCSELILNPARDVPNVEGARSIAEATGESILITVNETQNEVSGFRIRGHENPTPRNQAWPIEPSSKGPRTRQIGVGRLIDAAVGGL